MVASATIIGSFAARMGMDISDYAKGVIEGNALNRIFGEGVATFVANPLLGTIGILKNAGSAFLRLSDQVLSTAESVMKLSAETGISTDAIQALRSEFAMAGADIATADGLIKTFTKSIGDVRTKSRAGKLVASALETLGIDPNSIPTGEAGLRLIAGALARVTDEQARVSISSKIFGDAGVTLAIALGQSSNGLDGLITRAKNLGQVIDADSLPSLGRMEDGVDSLKAAVNGLLVQGTANFLAGFAGTDDVETSIENISAQLQDTIVPAMKELGQESRSWLNDLRDIREVLHEILVQIGVSQRTDTEKNLWAFLEGANQDLRKAINERDGYPQSRGMAWGGW